MNKIKISLIVAFIAFQMQSNNLNAEEKKIINEEELPAMDPFLGSAGVTGGNITSTNNNQNTGLLKDLRLVGTIVGANKSYAIFSAGDGSTLKYQTNQFITDTTTLVEILKDRILVKDEFDQKFYEVDMNNKIESNDG
ncbi:hypothetical protein OAO89_00290 [Pelagibacteraceae bacterium]|nr:hypothetical protein [Pelagibacteraceae bacterium]